MNLRVYNQAGELVRTYNENLNPFLQMPNDASVSPNPFSPDGDGYEDVTYLTFPDGQRLKWDGKTERGEFAQNGPYWLRSTFYTSDGAVAGQLDRKVVVLAGGNWVTLEIMDMAGGTLKTLAHVRVPYSVKDVLISPNPFTPGINKSGALTDCMIKLKNVDASVADKVFYWKGDDKEGSLLHSGTYWLRMHNVDALGHETNFSKSIVLLRGKFEMLRNTLAGPNPYEPFDGGTISFWYDSPFVLNVTARIFDLQGNEVGRAEGPQIVGPGTSEPYRCAVVWNPLTRDRLVVSDGLYYALLTAEEPVSKIRDRKIVKFAVLKRKSAG